MPSALKKISNTAWAFSTLEVLGRNLLNALAEAAMQQNFANLLWAFSSLKVHHETLFEAAVQRALTTLKDCDD